MRYERLTAISKRHEDLLALIRQGAHSSPHLAKELGVSEQTVYRDVLFLKRQGHHIKSVRLPTNWAYQMVTPSHQRQHSHKGAS
ncbi:MAG: helix-turn-helix domain-containing protein [Methylocella sp.]